MPCVIPRSFRAVQLLYNTVGYPREKGRWPLNKGWCTLNVISLSGYKIPVNMEPIQGNHDSIDVNQFCVRQPLTPSFPTLFHLLDKVLCLWQWPEIPSRALHLLDAGLAGETSYVGTSAGSNKEYQIFELRRNRSRHD